MAIEKTSFLDNDRRYQQTAPAVKELRGAADEAMDFQLWAIAQAHSLAKMKTFAAMAKTINDQQ